MVVYMVRNRKILLEVVANLGKKHDPRREGGGKNMIFRKNIHPCLETNELFLGYCNDSENVNVYYSQKNIPMLQFAKIVAIIIDFL